ncbi:MAG: T9SS type A sorting domain-containing protein, partial [Flavobacteriales bacterium]|nr:T9SS type A sorting domain-containing protein [Flavobacteriales bacterium]
IALLANITDECSVSMPVAPTATDSCAGSITGTTSTIFPITSIGTTVVVWEYNDGNGNTSTQSQNVIITPIDNSVIQTLDSLVANAVGYDYQWIDCDNGNTDISGENQQFFIPALSGSYAIEISNGTCTVVSACMDIAVGISDIKGTLDFQVHPNPFSNSVFIQSESIYKGVILIFDNLGKLLLKKEYQGNDITLDLSDFAKGVYYLKLESEQGSSVVKIVK